jgi:WD40 repeat protein
MSEEPAPLRSLRPSVALDLETICLKCLQRSPARRYETALEFIEELDRYTQGQPILARPVSKLEYAWRWCNRNRMVASLLTLLFLSLSIGLAGTTFYWLQARDYWLRAKTETEKTRRSLYASQMVLASDFLGNGEIEATRLVLDRFRAPELQHFRGFEWHYMAHKMGRFKQFAHHGNGIADIAISRDGNWFASIANDRALRIWDSQSGTQIREIPFEIGRWQAIAISRRNNLVAAGAKDGSVHLWKTIQEPTLPAKVIKHGRGVTIVKFSSDGKRLFSASDEGAIRVWDTSNFELLKAIPTGKAGLVDFAVSKDGTIVVMAGREGVMRAWQDNVDEYTKICEIPDGRRVESVAVSSRGERFVAGTFHGELMAYETAGGRKLFEQATPYDWMSQIEFLAASSIVAICSSAGTIAFFDVDRQRELESFATHDRAGGLFAVSTNAKSMVVGSATGAIRLLDISDYQQSNSIINDMPVRDARILADDVVIAAYKDGSVRRLDYRQKSFQLLKEPSEMQTRPAICASPETSLIAIAQQDGSIELLDSDGESIETIPKHNGAPIALRLSSPADLLVVTGQTGPIVGYDIQRNRDPVAFEKFSIATGSTANVRDVCISHDQRRIAVALSDNSVRFYDIVNGKWLAETLSLESTPVSISFAHGDLVVGTRDAFLRRFDGQALHEIWRTKAHIGHLNMIAVIPGGNAVATVGGDRELRIWDLDNGDLRVRLYGHVHQVFSVDASTAGRTLVTGGVQGKVRIWRSKPMH